MLLASRQVREQKSFMSRFLEDETDLVVTCQIYAWIGLCPYRGEIQ